jgi:hypothetical protein
MRKKEKLISNISIGKVYVLVTTGGEPPVVTNKSLIGVILGLIKAFME